MSLCWWLYRYLSDRIFTNDTKCYNTIYSTWFNIFWTIQEYHIILAFVLAWNCYKYFKFYLLFDSLNQRCFFDPLLMSSNAIAVMGILLKRMIRNSLQLFACERVSVWLHLSWWWWWQTRDVIELRLIIKHIILLMFNKYLMHS